eukprot:1137778-Pelagomonas_calceolata.AAC.2
MPQMKSNLDVLFFAENMVNLNADAIVLVLFFSPSLDQRPFEGLVWAMFGMETLRGKPFYFDYTFKFIAPKVRGGPAGTRPRTLADHCGDSPALRQAPNLAPSAERCRTQAALTSLLWCQNYVRGPWGSVQVGAPIGKACWRRRKDLHESASRYPSPPSPLGQN